MIEAYNVYSIHVQNIILTMCIRIALRTDCDFGGLNKFYIVNVYNNTSFVELYIFLNVLTYCIRARIFFAKIRTSKMVANCYNCL